MKHLFGSPRGNRLGWLGLVAFALLGVPMLQATKAAGQAPGGATVAAQPAPAAAPAASAPSPSAQAATTLSYVHDTAEGKRSLGGTGHAVEFARPEKGHFVEAVHIFGRYGMAQAPREDFHVYLLNEKKEVLADVKYPYGTIERVDMKWYDLPTPSIEVPERFLVALAFDPTQTKGIYLGVNEAAPGGHSFKGLPGSDFAKWGEKPGEKGDWMVRVDLAETPSGAKGVQRLADWKAPVSTNPLAGATEAKYDSGESSDKQSYGGSGPAIQFRLSDFGLAPSAAAAAAAPGGGAPAAGGPAPAGGPRLASIRLFAGRYGGGYDPAQTQVKVAILDSTNKVRWQGGFPYALFTPNSKWVDLVLKDPVAVRDLAGDDGVLTIALDPEAQQTKGIYFHYNKNPQKSHSFAGTVARGFEPTADREWIIRAYFAGAQESDAKTAQAATGSPSANPAAMATPGQATAAGSPGAAPAGLSATSQAPPASPAAPVAAAAAAAPAPTEAPKVVKMEPANGATGVDPKTTELRVTFNVPMGGGNSWCGGGPSFPNIPQGKRASWSDDHMTAILPVTLQPEKTYTLGLNAPSFKNFKSASGVPLVPVPYSFTTGK